LTYQSTQDVLVASYKSVVLVDIVDFSRIVTFELDKGLFVRYLKPQDMGASLERALHMGTATSIAKSNYGLLRDYRLVMSEVQSILTWLRYKETFPSGELRNVAVLLDGVVNAMIGLRSGRETPNNEPLWQLAYNLEIFFQTCVEAETEKDREDAFREFRTLTQDVERYLEAVPMDEDALAACESLHVLTQHARRGFSHK